jgi:hypothetical protein
MVYPFEPWHFHALNVLKERRHLEKNRREKTAMLEKEIII